MDNSGVVIKGNKNGLNALVDMNKFSGFDEMLDILKEKLSRGKKFYKDSTLYINIDISLFTEKNMKELKEINDQGTAVLLVTHDVKVAAKCSRVLYLVDGNIKGEYNLDKFTDASVMRERERALNNWLLEMGW